MNIIFQINGGIGKCIIATAVCKAIKNTFPDSNLIVVSGYPDVFLNNPNVYRAYAFGAISYFYDEHIKDKDFIVLAHDPYLETSHINKTEHLIETWCNLFHLIYNNETPELFLTEREIRFFSNKYVTTKPILLLQTNGGASSDLKYSWARDIPYNISVQIVEMFKDDYTILHIRRDDQLPLENTTQVSDSFRALVVLIKLSSKRLFMDSFAQHAAAALGLPSTVCWIVNSPKVFGYDIHNNIIANAETSKPELKNSYFNKYNISGELIEFPYTSETDIFNIDDIIKSIKNT